MYHIRPLGYRRRPTFLIGDNPVRPLAYSPFDDWENQTRPVRRVMEDAIDRRSVVTGSFAGDLPTRVAVAGEPWEVAARDLQPNAVARQKHVRRGPQVEAQLVDRI